MTCGEPAASSWITIDPYRGPAAVGANVTENVQLPAAETEFPQSLVAAKSPLTVMDEIDSSALPMFRKSALVAALLDPTGWLLYWRRNGLAETAGAESGATLTRKALLRPFKVAWTAPAVVGKSLENVSPPT
jgi:hypothetical protein